MVPEPIELPETILDAAKVSSTFYWLLSYYDPEISSSNQMEITRSEAEAMIRLVIPGPQASFIPYGMGPDDMGLGEDETETKDFPILRSGGWRIELVVRSRWCPILTISAFLRGPGYREGEKTPLVVISADAAKLYPHFVERAA
jgi:hypothetical protein